MSIISKLKASKTPKDLAEAVAAIDSEINSCNAEIKQLEDKREHVIFEEGEEAIARLQKDLGAKREHLDLLQVARRGAVSRLDEAEAAHRQRQLEARHKETLKLLSEERRLLKAWHLAAKALADLTGEIDAVQKAIAAENSAMRSAGREDLVVPLLAKEVNAKRRDIFESHCADTGVRPVNPPVTVSLNIPEQFRLEHYWPVPPQVEPGREWAGPPLALLD